MFVHNYNQRLIHIENPNATNEAIEGRWWHFHRVYVLKDEQEKMYTIRLNWFERVFAHVCYFGMERFFKAIFEGRKLVFLSAKELSCDPDTITPLNFKDLMALNNSSENAGCPENVGDIEIYKFPWDYVLTIGIPNKICPELPALQNVHITTNNDLFVVRAQLNGGDHPYKTLKGVLDHLFRGKYYQEDCLREIKYFTLTKKDGARFRYYNPYLK